MQEEVRLRTLARVWISFVAVVVNEQLGQPRQQSDQVQAAPVKPFANLLLGNWMPSFLNSRPHSRDMKLDAAQPYVPDANLQSRRQCRTQKRRDGVAAQRRLKCKIQSFRDCALEKSCSLIPSPAICFGFGEVRPGAPDSRCGIIGVEVACAFRKEHGAGDAALSCTVGSRQDVNAGRLVPIRHVCVQRLPQPFLTPLALHEKPRSCGREPLVFASSRGAHRILR